jgi:hypothetical protein
MIKKMMVCASLSLCSPVLHAAEWCTVSAGYRVTTHGNNSENVWLYGTLPGQATPIWMLIASGTSGKANVAVALAAQATGRQLLVYVNLPEHTCASFPNWSSEVRHLQMGD